MDAIRATHEVIVFRHKLWSHSSRTKQHNPRTKNPKDLISLIDRPHFPMELDQLSGPDPKNDTYLLVKYEVCPRARPDVELVVIIDLKPSIGQFGPINSGISP